MHQHAPHPAATSGETAEAHAHQRRVALISIFAAIALVVLKLGASLASGSLGLLAEALHSATDLVAAVLTFVAIKLGQRPPDRTHPWGHGRAEHLAALFEALLLLGAIIWIATSAGLRLLGGGGEVRVDAWTIGVMIIVIIIDVWRTTVSMRAAHEHGSPALASNALHFASDLAGSVAVLVGLVAAMAGFHAGDAIAALVVAGIIAVGAARLLWHNVQVLMDVAPEGAERLATRAVTSLDLPITLRRIRIRRSSGIYLADVVIGVAATDHVSQGHALASEVERAIEAVLPGSDIVVHVEPEEAGSSMRDRITAAALAHPGIHEVHDVRILLLDGVPEVSLHVKVRPDMRLDSAHDLADRIERSIRDAVPGMSHVDVHIEPVDHEAAVADAVDDAGLLDAMRRIVVDLTDHEPADMRVRVAAAGITAHVTVLADGAASLDEAHALATRVEEQICMAIPAIRKVIVHTEPFEAN